MEWNGEKEARWKRAGSEHARARARLVGVALLGFDRGGGGRAWKETRGRSRRGKRRVEGAEERLSELCD